MRAPKLTTLTGKPARLKKLFGLEITTMAQDIETYIARKAERQRLKLQREAQPALENPIVLERAPGTPPKIVLERERVRQPNVPWTAITVHDGDGV